ncbi:MAG: asparagine synthase (glutamine-hydrolyzing) [Paenibacillus sp.]|nr:asparagine synthase (glutamine-hydrolyzing) [Paenibacillus sp.]
MCGICGLTKQGIVSDEDINSVEKMNELLSHRGPDSHGMYSSSSTVLMMRRLKIIDLSTGDQPIFNEDRSIVLVANGEIYNYIELRSDLRNQGHNFNTGSDCETIIHLYEDYGIEGCLKNLRGMFAFALLDEKKKKLFLARDRMSEKPLYLQITKDRIIFSSELKSLRKALPDEVDIDMEAVDMFFHYQYIPEPSCIIKGVSKLPAAHYLEIDLENLSYSINRYWSPLDAEPIDGNPARRIREEFEIISDLIVRADVPVGIALSGGIDSGTIAAFCAPKYGAEMHAFSVGYPGRPKNDERSMAEELAKKLKMPFHDVELSTDAFVNKFPEIIYWSDDPIADIAAYGYYAVMKLARVHDVPVILSGMGGDELFWGYAWVNDLVVKNIRKKTFVNKRYLTRVFLKWTYMLSDVYKDFNLSTVYQIIKGRSIHAPSLNYLALPPKQMLFYENEPNFIESVKHVSKLYTTNFKNVIDSSLKYNMFVKENWDFVDLNVNELLFNTWLFSNCVALSDRMSMASSVELRLPFLDYKLVELVFGLRKRFSGDYAKGHKAWLREAMKGVVPNEIFNREKQGFTPPVTDWRRGVIGKYLNLVKDGYLIQKGILDAGYVSKLLDRSLNRNYAIELSYKITLLEIWCRLFINNTPYEELSEVVYRNGTVAV